MTENVIGINNGKYGRGQVTLLLPVKEEILNWANQLRINKAAFLRMALMIGASQLVKDSVLASTDELKLETQKVR